MELSRRMGYELKRAQAALRAAMDTALRGYGLTVPQYACLELLDQRPGLSNAELARGAFVTRPSMNVALRGLQDSGLVTRPPQAPHGRALPARLTAAGQRRPPAAPRAPLPPPTPLNPPPPPSAIRHFEEIQTPAAGAGLELLHDYPKPANNRTPVWRKRNE